MTRSLYPAFCKDDAEAIVCAALRSIFAMMVGICAWGATRELTLAPSIWTNPPTRAVERSETQTWRLDAKLASYGAARVGTGAWNETRNYVTYIGQTESSSVYDVRGQLLREPFASSASMNATYYYAFDGGSAASPNESGPGVRTYAYYSSGLNDQITLPGGETTFAQVGTESNTSQGAPRTFTWQYDGQGNVSGKVVSGGTNDALTWDALGRLVAVARGGATYTYNYDALGRRVREGGTGTAAYTIDSFFDPNVEFLEVGVAYSATSGITGANPGARTWKVYGPDLNGAYGGWQGTGGLEATIDETSGNVIGVINDAFGNVVATVSGGVATWTAPESGGYGLLPGSTAVNLNGSHTLAQATAWRGRRMDATGYYCLGARYYDPVSGRFLSPDPLGYSASGTLYDFCNGDPVNGFDPDGRFWKGVMSGDGNIPADAPNSGAFYAGAKISSIFGGIFSADTGSQIGQNFQSIGTGLQEGKDAFSDSVETLVSHPGQVWDRITDAGKTIQNYYTSPDFTPSGYADDLKFSAGDAASNITSNFNTQQKGFQSTGTIVFDLLSAELSGQVISSATQGFTLAAETGGGTLQGVQLNKAIGDVTSDAIASRYPVALREVPFETVGGTRIEDVVPLDGSGIAIESKVGATDLTPRVRQELARDWWLVRQCQLNGVTWEFTPSPITGQVGPSPALLQKLQKLGFGFKINE